MSKIDKLIKKHCPHGVEWMTLGDCIVENKGGGTPSKAKASYWGGDIPWASVGDLSIEGNYIETTRNFITEEGLKNSSSNLVQSGDLIVAIKIAPGKAKIASCDVAINQDLRGLTLKSFITVNFLVYYFQKLNFIGNGTIVKAITKQTLESTKIPVPPLPVQQEIVVILDSFTRLEAELEAELEARQKQYAYYCDTLLTFDGDSLSNHPLNELIKKHCPDGVEHKPLGEVILKTDNIQWSKNPDKEFQYIDLTSVDRITHAIVETSTITAETAPSRAQQIVHVGDMIFGTTRPMLKRYTAISSEYDRQICSTGFCVLRPDTTVVLTNFLYHMLGTSDFYKYVEKNERGANYPAIPDKLVKQFEIPVPPLPVQQEIVAILDKFDALTNSLQEGLPAEITARSQQYEHYRNTLLNFKELA